MATWDTVFVAIISGAPFVATTTADEPKLVRIGILPTMFRSGKAPSFALLRGPFVSVVESQTGSRYQLALLNSAREMQRELTEGRLQFALCHGFEFAWMKQADPKLRPLVIATPAQSPLKGYVVVTDTSSAKSLSDLRGTAVALPHGIHQTARLFAERDCQCVAGKPNDQFHEITTPINGETALHDLCDSKVQSAIVDTSAAPLLRGALSGALQTAAHHRGIADLSDDGDCHPRRWRRSECRSPIRIRHAESEKHDHRPATAGAHAVRGLRSSARRL